MATPTQHVGAPPAPCKSMGDAAPVAVPEGHSALGAPVGACEPAPSAEVALAAAALASSAEAASPAHTLARLKESVWYKVVGKGAALGALLTALALIGSWSTLHAKGEVTAEAPLGALESGALTGGADSPPQAGTLASGAAKDDRANDAASTEWLRTPQEPPARRRAGASRAGAGAEADASGGGARGGASGAQGAAGHAAPAARSGSSAQGGSAQGADAGAPPSERPPGITADGKVILNTATAEEFTRLPGVGPSRAEAIIKLRTRLKRFRKVSDLLRVRGIGVRSLKRLQPLVVVDPPPPPPSAEADAGSAPPSTK